MDPIKPLVCRQLVSWRGFWYGIALVGYVLAGRDLYLLHLLCMLLSVLTTNLHVWPGPGAAASFSSLSSRASCWTHQL
jgi:hypothetical protein